MATNGDDMAYPRFTKREEFAKAAMQGLLAHPENGNRSPKITAQWAVEQADALIAALNKEPEAQP